MKLLSGHEIFGREGFENPEDIALQLFSSAIQMNDFNGLLLKVLLDRYMVTALERVLGKKHPNLRSLQRNKNLLDTDIMTESEKYNVVREVFNIALEKEGKDLVFDVTMEEQAHKNPGTAIRIIDSAENLRVKATDEGEPTRFVLRHPVSLLATQSVAAPRGRKGANVRIGISIEAALHMFALNSNRPLMERITAASIRNTTFGAKVDPATGKNVVNESITQTILLVID